MVVDLPDLGATQALGRRLGGLLFPGSVVALVGPLGAGKTQLVRAVAEGLGVRDARLVTSPTFVLIQEYPARLPVYHFHAYPPQAGPGGVGRKASASVQRKRFMGTPLARSMTLRLARVWRRVAFSVFSSRSSSNCRRAIIRAGPSWSASKGLTR